MLTLDVIVVPTDFSERSREALDFAVGLATTFGSSIRLVHVIDPSLQLSDMVWVGVDQRAVDDGRVDTAVKSLKEIVTESVPDGIPVETKVLTGNVPNEIVLYANRHKADLVVMATHGRTGLSHVLMGSVAEVVVRHSRTAVLTLKVPADGAEDSVADDSDAAESSH